MFNADPRALKEINSGFVGDDGWLVGSRWEKVFERRNMFYKMGSKFL